MLFFSLGISIFKAKQPENIEFLMLTPPLAHLHILLSALFLYLELQFICFDSNGVSCIAF